MTIYVDQSGKIEYTSKDTIVAYADGKPIDFAQGLRQKSLLIKAEDKRKIQDIFRQAGKPHIFIYKTFAVLIYLLIKDDLAEIDSIVIDQEYGGWEALIKDFLFQLIRKKSKKLIDREFVHFKQIGRKNNAHKKAISAYRKRIKPDMAVSYKDILPYII